jgi:methyl-accepting chemotaxis protein
MESFMLSSLGLKAKLIAMCVLLASLTAMLGVIDKISGDSLGAAYLHIVKINLSNAQRLGDMRTAFKQARLSATRLVMEGVSPELTAAALADIDAMIKVYDDADKAYQAIPFAPGEDALYGPVAKIWDAHKTALRAIEKLAVSKDPEDHKRLVQEVQGDFVAIGQQFSVAIDALCAFQDKEAKKWETGAEELDQRTELLGLAIGAGSVLLALFLGFLVSSNLSTALGKLAQRLADGANAVAAASRQISEGSTEASASATETAAALQETVSSIDEVNAMVAKNADNAKRSFDTSTASKEAAARGKQAVDRMLASIDDISRSNGDIMVQTEQGNQEISSIVKVIAEIGNKTKVINDIVFQTKLLSFNASVEAARAGEHGKGFAVVAEEVGNLAQMSGNAAKEISQLLEESIRKVESTVTETQSKIERLIAAGRDKIEAGTVTARHCGESLDEIVRQVGELNHMVNEISSASREQAQGVQEITKALSQIDQGMQQSTTVAGQSAAASEDLSRQAASLKEVVGELTATVHGAGKQPALAPGSAPHPTAHATDTRERATVVPFRRRKPAIAARADAHPQPLKRVVGAEDVPAESDPRFEEI